MGYCLGGTLLAVAAAALAAPAQRRPALAGLPRLRSLTLLAAQVDFSEPGELGALIDEQQVQWLEDMMAERGYLSGRQMAGSFQFLHSRELVWQRAIREYLLGEREAPNDLMRWNADATRLPATMHSEYLRSLYLRNELAQGRYPVDGEPVSLHDLRLPVFAVGTVTDHVSPWRSVHKIHQLTQSPVDFVLTRGGHNAGIISEPGHANRSYRRLALAADAPRLSPQAWQAQAPEFEGSWWPAWSDWLKAQGSGEQVPARQPLHTPELGAAPGHYVMQRYAD
jgi:polyhydroxyalkanoate synthase